MSLLDSEKKLMENGDINNYIKYLENENKILKMEIKILKNKNINNIDNTSYDIYGYKNLEDINKKQWEVW